MMPTLKWRSFEPQVRQLRSDNCNGQVRNEALRDYLSSTNVRLCGRVRNSGACTGQRFHRLLLRLLHQVNLAVAIIWLAAEENTLKH